MNDQERATGVDYAFQQFSPGSFVTTDARQMAFDNFESLWLAQSGLTGMIPQQNVNSYMNPIAFGYTINKVGIGGDPSPIARGDMQPLVTSAEFADQFISQVGHARYGQVGDNQPQFY